MVAFKITSKLHIVVREKLLVSGGLTEMIYHSLKVPELGKVEKCT